VTKSSSIAIGGVTYATFSSEPITPRRVAPDSQGALGQVRARTLAAKLTRDDLSETLLVGWLGRHEPHGLTDRNGQQQERRRLRVRSARITATAFTTPTCAPPRIVSGEFVKD
jgi:hypothetical protein